jgi:GAF domain-containing protein
MSGISENGTKIATVDDGMDLVEHIERACARAGFLLDTNAARDEVLEHLAVAAEVASGPGAVASILVLDEHGLLRNGASPNLPLDYLAAIDRLKPHPEVGTCAAAAATGAVVVTPDFLADGKWAELRHLPLALGFVGAWSMPIKSPTDGRVLGTFGTYYRDVREPSADERAAIGRLAAVAARVLDPG